MSECIPYCDMELFLKDDQAMLAGAYHFLITWQDILYVLECPGQMAQSIILGI